MSFQGKIRMPRRIRIKYIDTSRSFEEFTKKTQKRNILWRIGAQGKRPIRKLRKAQFYRKRRLRKDDAKTTNERKPDFEFEPAPARPNVKTLLLKRKQQQKNLPSQTTIATKGAKFAARDGRWFRIGPSARPSKRPNFVARPWAGVKKKKWTWLLQNLHIRKKNTIPKKLTKNKNILQNKTLFSVPKLTSQKIHCNTAKKVGKKLPKRQKPFKDKRQMANFKYLCDGS